MAKYSSSKSSKNFDYHNFVILQKNAKQIFEVFGIEVEKAGSKDGVKKQLQKLIRTNVNEMLQTPEIDLKKEFALIVTNPEIVKQRLESRV